ncbi:GH32 C-terminal domain-containing protein [Flavobacterium sp. DSR3-2]|uniref:GH32 C-terminal domain-containing protein n=1 Tax=Flavobacterium sp. DSR3-2 TaxID=2804634 RepID=UPI003CEEF0BB
MTLPRELSLVKINNNYVLKNSPIEPFKKQLVLEFSEDLLIIKPMQKIKFTYDNFNQSEIKFKAASKNLKLVFSNEVNDSLVLNYDAAQKTFSIDRRHSGIVNFEENFGKEIHTTATPWIISENVDFQIILDWSSVEIFLNGGVYSFTEQIFPNKPYTKLSIQSDEKQEIKNLTVHRIKGIW